MEVIELEYPFNPTEIDKQPKVMALGFFDGVHLGHQAVIKTAVTSGKQRHLPVAVMTFDQYPGVVFNQVKASDFDYLSSIARKKEIIASLGVDYLYVVHLNELVAKLKPQEFVDKFLIALTVKIAVAGFDYTYGRPIEKADMKILPMYAQQRFDVITVPRQNYRRAKIASSAIRTALDKGDVNSANQLFGYIYQTTGVVVHGEARGRTLGFPTANIVTTANERIPGIGIYVTEVQVNDHWYHAMTSIGRNITFGDQRPVTIEANLLNFNEDIYDKTVKVRWYHYLRGEVKFSGAADLITQLNQDQQQTEKYFSESSSFLDN